MRWACVADDHVVGGGGSGVGVGEGVRDRVAPGEIGCIPDGFGNGQIRGEDVEASGRVAEEGVGIQKVVERTGYWRRGILGIGRGGTQFDDVAVEHRLEDTAVR